MDLRLFSTGLYQLQVISVHVSCLLAGPLVQETSPQHTDPTRRPSTPTLGDPSEKPAGVSLQSDIKTLGFQNVIR